MKFYLITYLFLSSSCCFSQNSTEKLVWKAFSYKRPDYGYNIQFKYPSYFKLDLIENSICLGESLTKLEEYNNTMDWVIAIYDPINFLDFKGEFRNDFKIKKDTIVLSKIKSLRTIVTQSCGKKYYEIIVIKFSDCVFEITNKKGGSEDFKLFCDSIIITSVGLSVFK